MPEFLVELYAARTDRAAVCGHAQHVRLAAEELTRAGTPVRLLRSIFVPEDETCFYLFEAGSIDVVREAAQRAGLEVEHVSEAVPDVAVDTA